MTLIAHSEALHERIDPRAVPQAVATGFGFTEGPIWDTREQVVIFSDIRESTQYRWQAETGARAIRQPSNKANGNAFDRHPDRIGQIVTCEHATSRVVRWHPDGPESAAVLASRHGGAALNSPNDVVVARDGAIYFTDPTFGRIREDVGVFRDIEQDARAVYRIDPETNALARVAAGFRQPNGLCFDREERRLYVNDTLRLSIELFDIAADGGLENRRLFAQTRARDGSLPDGSIPGTRVGVKPDGMKIDRDGVVYCTGPGGIHVFDRDGTALGIIEMPEHTTNFCFGGADLRTLYITASTSLYALPVRVPGLALDGR